MPVGMTLQQLYSQPVYHGDATSGMDASVTTTMSSVASGSVLTASANKPRTASPPTTNDKDYANNHPRMMHDANSYEPRNPTNAYHHEHHTPMQSYAPPPQQSYGQSMPPPHAYAGQYHPKHNTTSDEYGIADPLPFEYAGMRKSYPDTLKDSDVVHPRYQGGGGGAPPPPPQMQPSYAGNYGGGHSPHPSVYESQHAHPPKSVEERAYHQPSYAHDRPTYDQHYAHNANNMPPHLYAHHAHNVPPPHQHHAFPPLIDTQSIKKDTSQGPPQPPQQYSPHGPVEFATNTSATANTQSASQEAVIKVKTPLKTKYWRNGRRNLQCFPSCKVFGDYSSIKIEDLKQHDFMWGKCRGSLITEVTLNSSVSFDDILILSRVHSMENVPVAFEEAVIRECMLGRMVEPDVMDTMKDQWITGERLPDFVQQEGNTACYEFKPKVWKYTEDMTQGKCKRRNVKYYVQFEAFVLVMSGERRYYACIGSGMSTAFEVGSSRVLARQKRKAATGLDANPLYLKSGQNSPTDNGMTSHPMMQPHPMMGGPPPQHGGMHQQMYPSYPPQAYPPGPPPRSMPPPSMHPSMMHPMHHGDHNGAPIHHGYQQQMPPQHQQPPPQLAMPPPTMAPSGGQKRKASPTESAGQRPTKAKKSA